MLEFLDCPVCGAATPLVGQDWVECIYCGNGIAVPKRIGAPVRDFHQQLASMKQQVDRPSSAPGQWFSLGLALLMTVTLSVFVGWWCRGNLGGTTSIAATTYVVLAELLALPLGLVVLSLAGRDSENFAKAHLAFANLKLDVSQAVLSCPRCSAPLDCKEVRDIVIACPHCRTELLIPLVLVADKLQATLRRILQLRGRSFDPYPIIKWVLVGLTAVNGIVPVVLLSGATEAAQTLIYLTGFTWAYMVNWLCSLWALRNHGRTYAVVSFILFMPLPAYFLLMMAGTLVRHHRGGV
jgi:hypothetical protein